MDGQGGEAVLRDRAWFLFSCDEQAATQAQSSEQTDTGETAPAAAAEGDSPNAALQQSPPEQDTPSEHNTAAESAPLPDTGRLEAHITQLRRQEAQLKELIPNFDLQRELAANPRLLQLTAPGSPLTLAEALTAVHLPRLLRLRDMQLVQRTRESLAMSISSGTYRPPLLEGSLAAGLEAPMDREKLKERIRGGEKIRP